MTTKLLLFYVIGIFFVLAGGFLTLVVFLRSNRKIPVWVFPVTIAFSIYILFAQYFKYLSLHFYVDFSHWAQLIYNITVDLKPTVNSVEFLIPGGLNYLSVHFVPLVYLFAAPFKVFPYLGTIITLNFILMFSSIVPLYKLGCSFRYSRNFCLFICSLLLWYPTFQYIGLYEFEMLRFSIPIILWMLFFWNEKKASLYFLFAVLAVLVREDVCLVIAMFGIYGLLIEKRRRDGALTFCLGLCAFIIITMFIMPLLRNSIHQDHVAAYWFNSFGKTPFEIVANIIRNPKSFISFFFHPVKLGNMFMYFLPLLFIPLLAPSVLISTLASFGLGLFSLSPTHISYMLYYLSPAIPFIFYAFLKGWPKFLSLLGYLSRKSRLPGLNNIEDAAMAAILSGLLVSNIFFGPSPISLQFWFRDIKPAPFRTLNFHYSSYYVAKHQAKVEGFTKIIPDHAIVSAEQFLAPRLYKKKGIMVFPQLESVDGKIKADYAFIDKNNPVKTGISTVPGSWDGLRQNPQHYYDLIEKDQLHWQLIKADDGYFLYKRVK